MKLEDVVVGKEYRIKDDERVDEEYRGTTGVVAEKGDVFSQLTKMMIGDKEGVKFESGKTGLARDIEPVEEEIEVGDEVYCTDTARMRNTGELMVKFDEKDYGENDAIVKTKDSDGDIFYDKFNSDYLQPIEKAKESLSEGDRFLLKGLFGAEKEFKVLHKTTGNHYGEETVVYTAEDLEDGEITTVPADRIDEILWIAN